MEEDCQEATEAAPGRAKPSIGAGYILDKQPPPHEDTEKL